MITLSPSFSYYYYFIFFSSVKLRLLLLEFSSLNVEYLLVFRQNLFIATLAHLVHFVLGVEFQESLDQTDQMFKPGWKDIFRMNQNELESEIRKVYRDATLDPRRKAYLVQNLMTRLISYSNLEPFRDCYFIFILTHITRS